MKKLVNIFTHSHTFLHTHIHTHTHKYIHIYSHTTILSHTQSYIHTHTPPHSHIHSQYTPHSQMHTYTHALCGAWLPLVYFFTWCSFFGTWNIHYNFITLCLYIYSYECNAHVGSYAMTGVECRGRPRSWCSPSTTWSQSLSSASGSSTEAIFMVPEMFFDNIFCLENFVMIFNNQTAVTTALLGTDFLLISQKTANPLVFCFDWLLLCPWFLVLLFFYRKSHAQEVRRQTG